MPRHWFMLAVVFLVGWFVGKKYPTLIPLPSALGG